MIRPSHAGLIGLVGPGRGWPAFYSTVLSPYVIGRRQMLRIGIRTSMAKRIDRAADPGRSSSCRQFETVALWVLPSEPTVSISSLSEPAATC